MKASSGLVKVSSGLVKIFSGLAKHPCWRYVVGRDTGDLFLGGSSEVSVSTVNSSCDHLPHQSRGDELDHQAPSGDRGREADVACAGPQIQSDPPGRT